MKKIVVVSDNPFWYEFVVETLNRNLYQVRHRTFGSCLKRIPQVDLILLDEFFAGIRQEQVLELVTKAKGQKVRVTYTGGSARLASIFTAGAIHYFSQTWDPDLLEKAVEESFRHGVPR